MFCGKYRIIVFDYDNCNELIFDSGVEHYLKGKKIIALAYTRSHLHAIISISGYLEVHDFCNYCLEVTRTKAWKRGTHTCKYVCNLCYGVCAMDTGEQENIIQNAAENHPSEII